MKLVPIKLDTGNRYAYNLLAGAIKDHQAVSYPPGCGACGNPTFLLEPSGDRASEMMRLILVDGASSGKRSIT